MNYLIGTAKTIYDDQKAAIGIFHPLEHTHEKCAYVVSALLFASLFVLSCVAAYHPGGLANYEWVALGLTLASLVAALSAKLWNHGPIGSKKLPLGLIKEAILTIVIFSILVAGLVKGTPTSSIAKDIMTTQLVVGGVCYGIAGFLAPLVIDSALSQSSLLRQSLKYGEVAYGTRGENGREKRAWMLSGALMITSFILSVMAGMGGMDITYLNWVNLALTGTSFALLMRAGLFKHGTTLNETGKHRPGLWREIAVLAISIFLSTLPLYTNCTMQQMALGYVAMHLVTTGIFAWTASKLAEKRERERQAETDTQRLIQPPPPPPPPPADTVVPIATAKPNGEIEL